MVAVFLLVSLSILVIFLTWFIPKLLEYRRLVKIVSVLPGTPTHWLTGNLHQIILTESWLMGHLKRHYDNKEKISQFWMGPFWVAIVIFHPDGLKNILKEPKEERMYRLIEPWLGKGLLISNGKRWYRNRRLLTPAFHFDILKPYVYIYNEATHVLLNNWETAMKKGEPVSTYSSISKLSLDIILQCAFSYTSDCQSKTNDSYSSAVRDLCDLSGRRMMSPLLFMSDFLYYYCTPQGWRYRRALRVVHGQAEKIIQKRKQELGLNTDQGSQRQQSETFKMAKAANRHLDFLDVLLTAKDEDGCGLTDLDIRYEVDTFMFEGHDTTANGLTWCLYLLAKHPEHQEKCREEIQNVLRGKSHLDYDDLPELKYTQWCIKETLRLYPPVHEVFRRLSEDTDICGHVIPKGTQISLTIVGVHRNPNVWENPLEFNPLRFHPDNISDRVPFSYIPFSAGQRNCIGQNFAMNEQIVVIGLILNRFSLHLVKDEEVKALPLVLFIAEKEIELYLKPVSSA